MVQIVVKHVLVLQLYGGFYQLPPCFKLLFRLSKKTEYFCVGWFVFSQGSAIEKRDFDKHFMPQ